MQQLRVLNQKPVQEDFWGNGAVYHGYAGMPDCAGRVYSEELCEIEAKRAADMKLKIARTFYGWWAWEAETQKWNWENDRMRPFYRWLQRMKDADVTVALNTGWCSPGDINSTSWNGESPFTVSGDWEQSKQNYADWVSESFHQLVELRGFTNIKIFVMFTEPQHLSGTSSNGSGAYETWAEAVKTVHETLVRDGRRDRIKLMGPNEGSTTTSEMLHWVAEHCDKYVDIYSSHTYLFSPTLLKNDCKTNDCAVTFSMPGGRISRNLTLEADTEYEVLIDSFFRPSSPVDSLVGEVVFGLFKHEPENQRSGFDQPLVGATKDSICFLPASELKDSYHEYTFRFKTDGAVTGKIGLFHDVKTYGTLLLDRICLRRVGQKENLIPNGGFSSQYDGWTTFYCGATLDAYQDWMTWASTGLQYVPNGKPYCFDEYNAVYNRDNSRMNHGSDIVNAAIAFMNAGAQSSLLWTVFDQQWPNSHTTNGDSFFDGDHRCGTMPILTRSLVPHQSYYAFSLLSRYVDGAGTKVYKGLGVHALNATMSVSKEGEVTVVVVNDQEGAEDFTLQFEVPLHKTLHRHRFDPATCVPDETASIIPADADFEVVDTITDSIAPYSVTVYTTHKD